MFRGARRALHFAGVNLIAFLRSIPGYFGTWPMQELTGTTALADNVAVPLGRDLLEPHHDFTAVTWLAINGAADDADSFTTAGAGGMRVDEQSIATAKTYTARVKGTTTATSLTVRDYDSTIIYKTIIGSGAFDESFAFTAATEGIYFHNTVAGTTDIDWANSYIQQTGILNSRDYPGAEELNEAGASGTATAANFTSGSGGALSNTIPNYLRVAGTADTLVYGSQTAMTVGLRYRIKGSARGTGGAYSPNVWNGTGDIVWTGTNSTTAQAFDFEIVAVDTDILYVGTGASSTDYVEFTELSITPANPLNGDYVGVTLAQTGAGNIPYMPFFDATTSYLNIHSAELNSAFNPSAGTLMIPCRVANAGVWTDSATRYLGILWVDASNYLLIQKSTVDNTILGQYRAGGTVKSVSSTAMGGNLGMFIATLTWDTSADIVKLYLNNVMVSASGLGAWVGNLSSTETVIGARNTTPTNVWSGDLAYPILARSAWDATAIAQINAAFGVA